MIFQERKFIQHFPEVLSAVQLLNAFRREVFFHFISPLRTRSTIWILPRFCFPFLLSSSDRFVWTLLKQRRTLPCSTAGRWPPTPRRPTAMSTCTRASTTARDSTIKHPNFKRSVNQSVFVPFYSFYWLVTTLACFPIRHFAGNDEYGEAIKLL